MKTAELALRLPFVLVATSISYGAAASPTTNLQRCVTPAELETWGADTDFFPEKYVPHSTTDLFTITYHRTYKVVTNEFQNKSYLLYQCGTAPPAEEVGSGRHHLALPVPHSGGVAITETPQIPPLELLGRRRDVAAYVGNPKYVSSSCLDYMMDIEKSVRVIFDPNDPWNATKTGMATREWLEDNPDAVIFGGPYGDKDGDRVLSVAASQERTNVATFDWIGVYAALFNLERLAADIAARTEARYGCSSSNAQALSADLPEDERPTMLWANYFDGYGWSVSECPTWDAAYYCEYARHCGTNLLSRPEGVGWNNPDYGGRYWYLNDTELLELGRDAQYWIYPSKTWDAVYEQKRDLLDQFRSVRDGQVYDTQGQGPFSWHEQRLAEYDVVALDFCDIVGLTNPATNPPHVRRWFRNVFSEAVGFPKTCDAPDEIDEPYVPNESECTMIGGGGSDVPAPTPTEGSLTSSNVPDPASTDGSSTSSSVPVPTPTEGSSTSGSSRFRRPSSLISSGVAAATAAACAYVFYSL